MSKKSFYITFEGGEGGGKTTQIAKLKELFVSLDIDSVFTNEPGGTKLAGMVRQILLTKDVGKLDSLSEVFLHFAARRESLTNVVLPALEDGKIVVSDRSVDSSRVYQGYGMGVDMKVIDDLYKMVGGDLQPDITFILDMDPKLGIALSLKHNKDTDSKEDRYENMALDFHKSVRSGFLKIAEKYNKRCIVINALEEVDGQMVRKSIEKVHQEILGHIEARLGISLKSSNPVLQSKNDKPV